MYRRDRNDQRRLRRYGANRLAYQKNQSSYDEVVERFQRRTVDLHYRVSVQAPVYGRNSKIAEKPSKCGKRCHATMTGGEETSGTRLSSSDNREHNEGGDTAEHPITMNRDGNIVMMELPRGRIYSTWPECSVKYIVETVPRRCDGTYAMEVALSLHALAAGILVEYTRARDVLDFMRSSKHALRTIHTLALGLPGLLRHALDLPRLTIEEKARGRAVLDVVKEAGEVSVLCTSNEKTRPSWGPQDDVTHLTIRYSDYIRHVLVCAYEKGSRNPKTSPERAANTLIPARGLEDCDVLNSVE